MYVCYIFQFFLFAKPLTTANLWGNEKCRPNRGEKHNDLLSANYSYHYNYNNTKAATTTTHPTVGTTQFPPPGRPIPSRETIRLRVSTLPSYRALVVSIKKGQEQREKRQSKKKANE